MRLKLAKDSRPVLRIVEKGASGQPVRIPLNHAAGLDVPQTTPVLFFKLAGDTNLAVKDDVVFVPEAEVVLQPGVTYRLALSTTTPQDRMLWLSGDVPQREDGNARHAGQVYGQGEPASWSTRSEVVNLYEVRGRWSDKRPEQLADNKPPIESYAEFSGIYPHLAMFNTTRPGECGIGAVVNWADRLWAVTYSPYHQLGSPDKLFQIDRDQHIYVHPESVGGTPANRMIHEESGQLLIGPYLIDDERRVRVIPPRKMPGRLTGTARHLTDPANKVYYASMEEAFYEVDIHTLEVTQIHGDTRVTRSKGFAHGNHGKGLYSGQGRVIYANNGGGGHNWKSHPQTQSGFQAKSVRSIEWDGKAWQEVHRTGFLDVSGPGGIRGNSQSRDRSRMGDRLGLPLRAVLKVLDGGEWHTYRLPKASHTMDGPHGYNTEWPRIGEIGSDTERLIYVHGMFWKLPTKFSTQQSRWTATAIDLPENGQRLDTLGRSNRVRAATICRTNFRRSDSTSALIRGNLVPSISHANLWFVEAGAD